MAQSLEQRVARLEKQNRILRLVVVAGVMLAGGMAVVGQVAPQGVPDLVRAKKIQVVGAGGNVLLSAGQDVAGNGALEVFNNQGNRMIVMGTAQGGGAGNITTQAANGNVLIMLTAIKAPSGPVAPAAGAAPAPVAGGAAPPPAMAPAAATPDAGAVVTFGPEQRQYVEVSADVGGGSVLVDNKSGQAVGGLSVDPEGLARVGVMRDGKLSEIKPAP